MIIGYADVDDTHTSFEETTSVLSENIKQLIVAMGTDEKFALPSPNQHKKNCAPALPLHSAGAQSAYVT